MAIISMVNVARRRNSNRVRRSLKPLNQLKRLPLRKPCIAQTTYIELFTCPFRSISLLRTLHSTDVVIIFGRYKGSSKVSLLANSLHKAHSCNFSKRTILRVFISNKIHCERAENKGSLFAFNAENSRYVATSSLTEGHVVICTRSF